MELGISLISEGRLSATPTTPISRDLSSLDYRGSASSRSLKYEAHRVAVLRAKPANSW